MSESWSDEEYLAPAQRTLPAMLLREAARFADRPLLKIGNQAWSHREAAQVAAGRAASLQAAGVGRGDRVALMTGNRIEFVDAFLGCGWLGAVAVPLNTAAMGPQVEYFLANSAATLLIIEDVFVERLAVADLGRTALKAIWVVGEGAGTGEDHRPSALQGVPVAVWPGAARAEPASPGRRVVDPALPDPAAIRPGDPLAILYTSGTTGPAKGVICPHGQYYWWGSNSLRVLGVAADDVLCTTLPLFHINALNTLAQAMLAGAEVCFETRFSASGFWPAMRARRATVIYLLGAMVPILLARPASADEREHRIRVGLGPGVPETAGEAFFTRTGIRLLEGYGSTETNFTVATALDSPRRGIMGWVLPGFEARVADAHDNALPAGEAGELLLRATAPYAFASGYFGMPDKTVEAWRNLWFHTGDRVVQEADGALRFLDRIKDAIRRRGENISSFEVEQVLLEHPDVEAVAVFPVRSELAEDEVMAALTVVAGRTFDPEALTAWSQARLPYFAVPRYLEAMSTLPRTENGKIQKYRLRERGVTTTTWERPAAANR